MESAEPADAAKAPRQSCNSIMSLSVSSDFTSLRIASLRAIHFGITLLFCCHVPRAIAKAVPRWASSSTSRAAFWIDVERLDDRGVAFRIASSKWLTAF